MTQQVITSSLAPAKAAPPDPYQDRLLKLIPAEVVSVYLAVFQLLPKGDDKTWLSYTVFVVLGLANILYKKHAGVTDWRQLLISTVGFCLWVMSLGGPVKGAGYTVDTQQFAAIFIPIYTLFVPLIYK